MASEMVAPTDWSHPPSYTGQYPLSPRIAHCNAGWAANHKTCCTESAANVRPSATQGMCMFSHKNNHKLCMVLLDAAMVKSYYPLATITNGCENGKMIVRVDFPGFGIPSFQLNWNTLLKIVFQEQSYLRVENPSGQSLAPDNFCRVIRLIMAQPQTAAVHTMF